MEQRQKGSWSDRGDEGPQRARIEAGAAGAVDPLREHRAHLFGVAYRMLGSSSEADDVLQEAWLRTRDVPDAEMRSPRAYLTSVVVRLCLDVLRSSRVRAEYVGPWLPEPVRTSEPADLGVERASSLSFAFLLLLESLSPLERAVFLLREVFDYEHREIAAVLERDEAAVRKLLQRAKAHVDEGAPRFVAKPEDHERLLSQFMVAVTSGDVNGLEKLLTDDVSAHTDGGGRIHAALKVVRGRNEVARLFVGLAKKMVAVAQYEAQFESVNGMPSLTITADGVLDQVLSIELDGDRIRAIHVVRNPDKLARFAGVEQRPPGVPAAGTDGSRSPTSR